MKTYKNFFFGIITGAISMITIYYLFFKKADGDTFKYIQIRQDCLIENVGFVKKGTILRIDKSMPEGFTRYILYLNLKKAKTELYKTEHPDEIIPYWLNPNTP